MRSEEELGGEVGVLSSRKAGALVPGSVQRPCPSRAVLHQASLESPCAGSSGEHGSQTVAAPNTPMQTQAGAGMAKPPSYSFTHRLLHSFIHTGKGGLTRKPQAGGAASGVASAVTCSSEGAAPFISSQLI